MEGSGTRGGSERRMLLGLQMIMNPDDLPCNGLSHRPSIQQTRKTLPHDRRQAERSGGPPSPAEPGSQPAQSPFRTREPLFRIWNNCGEFRAALSSQPFPSFSPSFLLLIDLPHHHRLSKHRLHRYTKLLSSLSSPSCLVITMETSIPILGPGPTARVSFFLLLLHFVVTNGC